MNVEVRDMTIKFADSFYYIMLASLEELTAIIMFVYFLSIHLTIFTFLYNNFGLSLSVFITSNICCRDYGNRL